MASLLSLLSFVLWGFCPIFGLAMDEEQERAQGAEEARVQLIQIVEKLVPPERVGFDPELDLRWLGRLPELRSLIDETQKSFAKEISTDRQPYRNLAGTLRSTRERIDVFEKSATKYASIDRIQEDAAHIRKMIAMSREYRAPAYFREGNDIANRLETIRSRIRMMESLSQETGEMEKAKRLLNGLQEETLKGQKELLSEIIQQNELPKDGYRQKDRDELLKVIGSLWSKEMPSVKPLKIGLIGDHWTRKEAWEFQNRTLYRIDRSRIQGFVIIPNEKEVPSEKDTVVCRNVQLQRDHVEGGQISAWLVSDPKRPPEPLELILKSKLK